MASAEAIIIPDQLTIPLIIRRVERHLTRGTKRASTIVPNLDLESLRQGLQEKGIDLYESPESETCFAEGLYGSMFSITPTEQGYQLIVDYLPTS